MNRSRQMPAQSEQIAYHTINRKKALGVARGLPSCGVQVVGGAWGGTPPCSERQLLTEADDR